MIFYSNLFISLFYLFHFNLNEKNYKEKDIDIDLSRGLLPSQTEVVDAIRSPTMRGHWSGAYLDTGFY